MTDPILMGEEVQRFLDSEPVQEAFEMLGRAAHKAWLEGTTVEAREAAWHRARSVEDVRKQLKVIVDRGTWARAERDKRAK